LSPLSTSDEDGKPLLEPRQILAGGGKSAKRTGQRVEERPLLDEGREKHRKKNRKKKTRKEKKRKGRTEIRNAKMQNYVCQ
jgi:hypothetical protein